MAWGGGGGGKEDEGCRLIGQLFFFFLNLELLLLDGMSFEDISSLEILENGVGGLPNAKVSNQKINSIISANHDS